MELGFNFCRGQETRWSARKRRVDRWTEELPGNGFVLFQLGIFLWEAYFLLGIFLREANMFLLLVVGWLMGLWVIQVCWRQYVLIVHACQYATSVEIFSTSREIWKSTWQHTVFGSSKVYCWHLTFLLMCIFLHFRRPNLKEQYRVEKIETNLSTINLSFSDSPWTHKFWAHRTFLQFEFWNIFGRSLFKKTKTLEIKSELTSCLAKSYCPAVSRI